jgi:glycosyltransferase involved in cell wall biosynthesis
MRIALIAPPWAPVPPTGYGGIEQAIDAHRAIAAARKAGARLVLAGKARESQEQAYLDKEIAPHLDGEVEYLGEVEHDDKLELLAGARATLFPIRWNEPFGLVMIESLACGTPVIAFAEGAAPEVIEHGVTGQICADEAEMANAIGAVESIDRASCRRAVEESFSVDRMVREHLDLFEAMVSRDPPGRAGPAPFMGPVLPHSAARTRAPAAGNGPRAWSGCWPRGCVPSAP